MRTRASTQSTELDAYLVTSYDEHMSDHLMESDERLKFLTGFTGTTGEAVVTTKSAALWVDARFYEQADFELNCDWRIFRSGEHPTISEWVVTELSPESRLGADPQLVPHSLWVSLERQLNSDYIKLIKIHRNLVDLVWGSRRPAPKLNSIKVQPLRFAGEHWEVKVNKLRSNLTAMRCDAMIVTSLTEVAYILNLRGSDIPYTPVFPLCHTICMRPLKFLYGSSHFAEPPSPLKAIKEYQDVLRDLRTLSQHWKRVLVPSAVVFDMGASEAIHSVLPREQVLDRPSPIIFLRAQKNEVEQQGMIKAHIRDGAAMCEVLSYLEERFIAGDHFTELSLAREVDRSRKIQDLSEGPSFKTIVAFGAHSAIPHYTPSNRTDFEITEYGTLLIDSGGQYQDGTTDVSRTIHLGEPHPDQIRAYTNVLIGMIRLSVLTFPENLKPAELDALARGPIKWMNDYNARIRQLVGDELKRKQKMEAFYWMMNKTRNIPEYRSEADYGAAGSVSLNFRVVALVLATIITNILFIG
ncbi:hypothetical protein RP20_CCG001990 [Aedes albopictus]|nr:hypothetical protein RP20_CCG001990 [Aedes albopictus]